MVYNLVVLQFDVGGGGGRVNKLQKTIQLKEELSSVVIIYKVDMFHVNDLTDQT
jgi:hypothetical protein